MLVTNMTLEEIALAITKKIGRELTDCEFVDLILMYEDMEVAKDEE